MFTFQYCVFCVHNFLLYFDYTVHNTSFAMPYAWECFIYELSVLEG